MTAVASPALTGASGAGVRRSARLRRVFGRSAVNVVLVLVGLSLAGAHASGCW